MTQKAEFKTLVRHAGTVLLGQLAVMAFGVTDTLIAGRDADATLAALSVGAAIYISIYVTLLGVQQALLPIWAELHGANQPDRLGASLHQAVYLNLLLIAIGVALLLSPGPLLQWAQVPDAQQAQVRAYLQILAWGLPAYMFFRLISVFHQSLGQPQWVTWLQVVGLLLKVPLSYVLTFHYAMGAAGCALATTVVHWCMCAAAVWLLFRGDYSRYHIWRRLDAPQARALWAFARQGVPVALAVGVEVTSFTMMSLFVARLGTTATAAHQVASNMGAVLYMVPLSIGIAASARVGYWLGAGDPVQARRSIGLSLGLAVGCAAVLALGLMLLRGPIAGLYLPQAASAVLAAQLLGWVAMYHMADAVQTLCVFILRCYRMTVTPLLVYSVLLWVVGLGGGYLWAYQGWGTWPAYPHPEAFWLCTTGALWLAMVVMAGLLRWQSGRAVRLAGGVHGS